VCVAERSLARRQVRLLCVFSLEFFFSNINDGAAEEQRNVGSRIAWNDKGTETILRYYASVMVA